MKSVLQKLCLMCLLLVSWSSFAQVSDYAVDGAQYGQQSGDEEFEAWCSRRLRDLDYARSQATREVVQGNYTKAVNILIGGLNQPIGRSFGRVSPITINLMTHAKNVAVGMMNNVGGEERGVKATIVALEAFYDLIRNAAYTVDFPYYRQNCGYCHHVNTIKFEQDVLVMVSDMLSIVNDNLLMTRGNQIFPVGPSNAYLKAAEVVTLAGYKELKSLLYAQAYSCEILDLRDISSDLGRFNSAPRSEYEKKSQIYESYYSINDLINKINNGYSCYNRR